MRRSAFWAHSSHFHKGFLTRLTTWEWTLGLCAGAKLPLVPPHPCAAPDRTLSPWSWLVQQRRSPARASHFGEEAPFTRRSAKPAKCTANPASRHLFHFPPSRARSRLRSPSRCRVDCAVFLHFHLTVFAPSAPSNSCLLADCQIALPAAPPASKTNRSCFPPSANKTLFFFWPCFGLDSFSRRARDPDHSCIPLDSTTFRFPFPLFYHRRRIVSTIERRPLRATAALRSLLLVTPPPPSAEHKRSGGNRVGSGRLRSLGAIPRRRSHAFPSVDAVPASTIFLVAGALPADPPTAKDALG